ncbi:MAG: DUF3806 domain-containing protein [Cellvibrionaceae bacterium]
MEQIISAPDDEWTTYIAKMWLLGNQISKDVLGEEMDGTLADLSRLQKIIDSNDVPASNTQELQSLGIVFGKMFIENTPDYDWWIVEDEYGKDACLRYKETILIIFPQTMISKRVEDGEELDVKEFYNMLKEDLEQIKSENYPNA